MTLFFAEAQATSQSQMDLKIKKPVIGRQGIQRNAFHRVVRFEEVGGKEFRFVQIQNYWGAESNWVGLFSPNSMEWEKYKEVKVALQKQTGETFRYHIFIIYIFLFLNKKCFYFFLLLKFEEARKIKVVLADGERIPI